MGKLHESHRIVVRGQFDKVVSNVDVESFAIGEPMYRAACADLEDGQVVTFQHGARVIKKSG